MFDRRGRRKKDVLPKRAFVSRMVCGDGLVTIVPDDDFSLLRQSTSSISIDGHHPGGVMKLCARIKTSNGVHGIESRGGKVEGGTNSEL